MLSERCSVSSSSGSSSTSASAGGMFYEGADRMVERELEAAETLADLAHFAMRECSGAESAGNWGHKGKRAGKRVKSKSPPTELGLNPGHPVTRSLDLAEDKAVVNHQKLGKLCSDALKEPVKAEQNPSNKKLKVERDAVLPKPSPICSTSYPAYGCGKSRRNLSEAEKEERRIRRVLANRESARQTIRRRQALCEELTRKAADLSQENEYLKRERESTLKEYQSLQTTNKHLKDQISKIKAEVEETPISHKPGSVQISPSPPTSCSLFFYNHPSFTPLFWPSISQSPNSVQPQHIQQNPIIMPSDIPLPANGRHDSYHEQENLININGARTPFYIFPCPWLFPRPDHKNAFQPQVPYFPKKEEEETSVNNQYSTTSSSRTVPHLDSHHSFLPLKVKTEASASMEAGPANDFHEISAGFSQDGVDQHIGSQPRDREWSFIHVPNVKQENGLQLDSTTHIETSSKAFHTSGAFPEKSGERTILPTKKVADAVAAAEARKRRKELTKLKNLHGRQCRMHC
ncbi:uncharacterized protein LOC107434956 isoform X2 [Ziziphus jujuba]|uniref:Uncharacterized protein LOC107434956 isoform X2 n=1 Tax=Ziziphus jujuba TaxID=326968 RepID=A0A6P4BRQ7_ZIZJJ|nr:uncharacterized protein LOC107434956 isoform X2 [Ziziphus jujuba]